MSKILKTFSDFVKMNEEIRYDEDLEDFAKQIKLFKENNLNDLEESTIEYIDDIYKEIENPNQTFRGYTSDFIDTLLDELINIGKEYNKLDFITEYSDITAEEVVESFSDKFSNKDGYDYKLFFEIYSGNDGVKHFYNDIENAYDDMVSDIEQSRHEDRDPYGARGLSKSDFM